MPIQGRMTGIALPSDPSSYQRSVGPVSPCGPALFYMKKRPVRSTRVRGPVGVGGYHIAQCHSNSKRKKPASD